jgi:hypothetical protein
MQLLPKLYGINVLSTFPTVTGKDLGWKGSRGCLQLRRSCQAELTKGSSGCINRVILDTYDISEVQSDADLRVLLRRLQYDF